MGNTALLCSVSWRPGAGNRWLLSVIFPLRPFARLKSRDSSEWVNNFTSISGQRICLELQLMEIYVRCLICAWNHVLVEPVFYTFLTTIILI